MHRPRQRGFTFIEVLMVVTIIGIIAALALPALSQTGPDKARSAARVLAADLDYARTASIDNPEDPLVVVFDTTDHGYYLAAASDTTATIDDPISHTPYTRQFGVGAVNTLAGVTIQSLAVGGDDQLGFDAWGATDQATDATITLSCDGTRIDLTVDPTAGEIAISDLY